MSDFNRGIEAAAQLLNQRANALRVVGKPHPFVDVELDAAAYEIRALRESPAPTLDECQAQVVDWGTECFGAEHMADHKVRALRLLEEAVEFAQSVDAPVEQCAKLVEYVYSRPKGHPSQELGGVGVGWVAAAAALEDSALQLLRIEIERVMNKPRIHFTQRNQNKLNAGFTGAEAGATPSPQQTQREKK
jgi:hypothetical protein